jgi:hypothetical protein
MINVTKTPPSRRKKIIFFLGAQPGNKISCKPTEYFCIIHKTKISHLVASLPTSCVHTHRACPKLSTSLEQLVNSCNNLFDRLVAMLFQQVRYSHDITIFLQLCVVNLVTFLLYHDCIRLVKTTL